MVPGAVTIAERDRVVPEILRRLEAGESMNAICKVEGIPSRETIRRWTADNAELAAQIMEARETGFMERAEQAVADAKAAKDPQLGRLAFDAERWYLGKLSNAFAERPAKIDSQTNVQVNNYGDGDPFGRLADFLDSAAGAISGRASSTQLVVGSCPPGPDSPAGGLDDVVDNGRPGVG